MLSHDRVDSAPELLVAYINQTLIKDYLSIETKKDAKRKVK
jgi:hypothetical protein